MRNTEVVRFEQRLDDLFAKIEDVPDLELKSHWARYLCILVSGYLETSVRAIYGEYSKNRANDNVANYVIADLNVSKALKWRTF